MSKSSAPGEKSSSEDPKRETGIKELYEMASSAQPCTPTNTSYANLLDVLRSTYARFPEAIPPPAAGNETSPTQDGISETATEGVSDVDNLTGLKEETKEVASSSDSVPAAVNPTGLREECDDSPDSDIEIIYRGRAELVTDSEDEEPEPGSPEFLKVPNYDYDTSEESE